jgi:hypothetical protein
MRATVAAIEGEYRRYKALADAALAQLDDHEIVATSPQAGNSIARRTSFA